MSGAAGVVSGAHLPYNVASASMSPPSGGGAAAHDERVEEAVKARMPPTGAEYGGYFAAAANDSAKEKGGYSYFGVEDLRLDGASPFLGLHERDPSGATSVSALTGRVSSVSSEERDGDDAKLEEALTRAFVLMGKMATGVALTEEEKAFLAEWAKSDLSKVPAEEFCDNLAKPA